MVSIKNCNNKFRFVAVFIIILGLLCFNSGIASAEETSDEKLKQQFEVAFNKMINDPADIDMTMDYANLAIELNNYEAAIPALERILLFNPNLPRIKSQLGVLYYKLDSYEMAKSYFEDAIKSKDVPQDVVEQSNKYLAKIK